ncbi:MAG: alcohol dehydrogenase catalytic domain-containing protein [Chloroflexi bacterium]|nr:alcohol dehydrogenase catalytic domain-containing protein [Chloroflexota bacterium]
MRAALLSDIRSIELIDIPEPKAGSGEAVLRVAANSICGSDLSAFRGVHPRIKPPTIPGHEFAGTVVELGPDVEGIEIGTRVCAEPILACNQCRYCLRGYPNLCLRYEVVGETEEMPGACAKLVKVPANQLYRLPDNISFAEGALVQPLSIAYHGARDRGQLSKDQLVLIFGAGPIGLGIMLAAKSFGARVIITDLIDYRLEFAERLGADVVVNGAHDDLEAIVRQESDGYGADVSFEAVGGGQVATFDQAVKLTARSGRVVVLGSFNSNNVPFRMIDFKFRELEIVGSQGHPRTFQPVIDLIASGKLPAGKLITHRVPLENIGEAFRLLETKDEEVMKVIIEP